MLSCEFWNMEHLLYRTRFYIEHLRWLLLYWHRSKVKWERTSQCNFLSEPQITKLNFFNVIEILSLKLTFFCKQRGNKFTWFICSTQISLFELLSICVSILPTPFHQSRTVISKKALFFTFIRLILIIKRTLRLLRSFC